MFEFRWRFQYHFEKSDEDFICNVVARNGMESIHKARELARNVCPHYDDVVCVSLENIAFVD